MQSSHCSQLWAALPDRLSFTLARCGQGDLGTRPRDAGTSSASFASMSFVPATRIASYGQRSCLLDIHGCVRPARRWETYNKAG